MSNKCNNCNSDIEHQEGASFCATCGSALDDSGYIKTNLTSAKLNRMGREVVISSVVKILFYIFKIVMSAIGLGEIRRLSFVGGEDERCTIATALFVTAIVIACVCLIHSIIVTVYGAKCGKSPFPTSNEKVFSRYKRASRYALMLAIFGFIFLAICTPAEWMLHLAEESLTSFRQDADAGDIARFVGDIVVDIVFILLSVLAYVHCKEIARCKAQE